MLNSVISRTNRMTHVGRRTLDRRDCRYRRAPPATKQRGNRTQLRLKVHQGQVWVRHRVDLADHMLLSDINFQCKLRCRNRQRQRPSNSSTASNSNLDLYKYRKSLVNRSKAGAYDKKWASTLNSIRNVNR